MENREPDLEWTEHLRNRCHRELRRRTHRRQAGRLFDSAAAVAIGIYVAAVLAVILRASAV